MGDRLGTPGAVGFSHFYNQGLLSAKEGPPWLGPTGELSIFHPPDWLAENASLEAINRDRTIKEKSLYRLVI